MPKALQFRQGSVIYFQDDQPDKIFLLQQGGVNLSYQNIETGLDVHELVQTGEFFGVRSTLGKYPREENAIAVQDSSVMAFTVNEFEQVATANTRIILKMLKVFSTQIRRIHKQVSNLLQENTDSDPEFGLFNLGEYYVKNKRFPQAQYVCSRYLIYYPSGKYADKAARYLEASELYLKKYGKGKPSAGGVSKGAAPSRSGPQKPALFPEGGAKPPAADTAQTYNSALNNIAQGKYQEAFTALKKIADSEGNSEYGAKSAFEMGRCIFLLGKHDECIKYYTQMLIKHPKYPDIANVLFFMGQSHEKASHKDQAISFYNKAIALSKPDGPGAKAKEALAALGG
ncbi:MAG: cyclic nucleotide-binding domain-containing protein [Treponema sp.]|jgi:TolA-binding protein|nr:cyclic nucleotide-binding domain-containing protein [Treponema sp.]